MSNIATIAAAMTTAPTSNAHRFGLVIPGLGEAENPEPRGKRTPLCHPLGSGFALTRAPE
jgi:hypothetical protein